MVVPQQYTQFTAYPQPQLSLFYFYENPMISQKILQKLGFSQKEIAVYLTLLELDTGTVTNIAKKSGINRTSCYDILHSLLYKGLITKFEKQKRQYYSARDPKYLLSYFENEKKALEKQLEKKKKSVVQILPELRSLVNPKSTTKPKVQFFEGEKGMREAYEDTLSSSEEILSYANVETMHDALPNFFPDYYQRRVEAQISIRGIFPQNKTSLKRAKKDSEEMRTSLSLPECSMTFSPEVNIYDNKMLIASWKEKMAVIIESKELADLQKLIYNLLWEYLQKEKKKRK
ncbi:MAG: hypothetical protein COV59_05770 [Candidatus Magasanikbacteria bacterium CG11_big_fil_rev_8_21_14_0_20_39_34]|uniref:Transcription regulator TrmB N-terminal domain-containing protein n=1 Tax=Candidatus Magasanikbacteria bacterium CG11_big_fil_rev_8_21_14_0_20_39_34 TaxID=1974653 RepID=A0A2H0N439_9BACT|nr:MAG: hypothetical protein COV59_05770 [Candidatus Magasanikbacteria bacterium CG11_big_fil_rev_8_21_14_0_20_39_34]